MEADKFYSLPHSTTLTTHCFSYYHSIKHAEKLPTKTNLVQDSKLAPSPLKSKAGVQSSLTNLSAAGPPKVTPKKTGLDDIAACYDHKV